MIDRHTSWVEATPLRNITTKEVIGAFTRDWVSRYGVPITLISDQGTQFESYTFNELCKYFGIDKKRTTAWHPQANGKIERWHRTLKNSLRAHSENANSTWLHDLPMILLSLRNCIIADTNNSPAQLVYGHSTRIPGDFIFETPMKDTYQNIQDIRNCINKLRPRSNKDYGKHYSYVNADLRSTKNVWLRQEVRTTLDNPYKGPYRVIERNDKTFVIDIDGINKRVSIDRLKPAYTYNHLEKKDQVANHSHTNTTLRQSTRNIYPPNRFKPK